MTTDRPLIRTPVSDLDTPALLVDLDALDHNFNYVAELYSGTVCRMRQHAKNVKCPPILHRQISAGGTVGGVCTAKVSEAEVMVEGGIGDILITSQVVTPDKIARVCSLAQIADVKVAVDDVRNLRLLSSISARHGSDVGIVIEVNTSMDRAGIRRPEQGIELARLATELPGVTFRGVMSHQSIQGAPDRETRFREGRHWMQMCIEAKQAIEDAGFPVEIVSTGETFTIDVAAEMPEVTEVQGRDVCPDGCELRLHGCTPARREGLDHVDQQTGRQHRDLRRWIPRAGIAWWGSTGGRWIWRRSS